MSLQEPQSLQQRRLHDTAGFDAAVESSKVQSTPRRALQEEKRALSSDALLPVAPQDRDFKKQSPSPAPGGGALAMLARSSLGMGLGEANASSTSLDNALEVRPSESGHSVRDETAKTGESSNIIIGPNGLLIPRSSILLNPMKRKSLVDAWRTYDEADGSPRPPAVLQIPVVPSAKDREAERERQKYEREREIEREWREKEQAEKVWGIPKKAFYMGLGEINFNAQMAMLAGWGNGSGGLYDFRPTPTTAMHRLRNTSTPTLSRQKKLKRSSSSKSGRRPGPPSEKVRRSTSGGSASRNSQQGRGSRPLHEPRHDPSDSDSDESMDLGELAALNAIINTRRSMEAAQLLAKGEHRPVASKRSVSSVGTSSKSREPKSSASHGDATNNPSLKSEASVDADVVSSSGTSLRTETSQRPHIFRSASAQPTTDSHRIRFAPLPYAYGPPAPPSPTAHRLSLPMEPEAQTTPTGVGDFHETLSNETRRLSEEGSFTSVDKSDDKSIMSDRSEVDSDDDSDETWGQRGSILKPKWYLMGMPKAVFTNPAKKQRRAASAHSANNVAAVELGSSPASEKRNSGHFSDTERKGRIRGRSRKPSSRASSVKSRSSSVGSFDEDERLRRRQLIRASRPGGTGMVTLPDGSRIRARRVGEEDPDDELQKHWGFARLVREAQRQQKDVEEDDAKSADANEEADDADMDVTGIMDESASIDAPEERQSVTPAHGPRVLTGEDTAPSSDFERAANDADGISSAKRRRRMRGWTTSSMAASTGEDDAQRDPSKAVHAGKGDTKMEISPTEPSQDLYHESSEDMRASPDLLESSQLLSSSTAEGNITATHAALKSAEAARAPKRSTTLPTGPISLSASQAAEVRRRHEREVLALGNEVLENMSKAKKARQHQQMAAVEQDDRSRGKEANESARHAISVSVPPMDQNARRTGPTSPQQGGNDSRAERGRERRLALRSSTLDEHRPSSQPRIQLLSSVVRGSSARRGTVHEEGNAIIEGDERQSTPDTGMSTPQSRWLGRPSTPQNDRTPGSADLSPSPNASRRHSMAVPSDAKHLQSPDLSNSLASLRSMSKSAHPSMAEPALDLGSDMTEIRSGRDEGAQPMKKESRDQEDDLKRALTPAEHRMRNERRHRVMIPPQELPRRPDQRGYAVVPLPHDQLGRRPARPMQGRFWQIDQQDDDALSSDDDDQGRYIVTQSPRASTRRTSERQEDFGADFPEYEDDSMDSELDADELAEEERRTAQQKQRATTRAAGAEVVRSTAAHRKMTSSPLGRSLTNGRGVSAKEGRSAAPSTPAYSALQPDHTPRKEKDVSAESVIEEVATRLQNLPLDSAKASKDIKLDERFVDSKPESSVARSTAASVEGEEAEKLSSKSSETDDDADLWPPTLTNALGTTPSSATHDLTLSRTRSSETGRSDARTPRVHRDSHSSAHSPGSFKRPLPERPSLRLRAATSFDMAAHAAKSRAARIKRGAQQRAAADAAAAKKSSEGGEQDESIDYGWPKSLQGSSLY